MAQQIRNRCIVLQAIAIHGPCTVKDLEAACPDLSPQQIQRAAYNLRESDDIIRVGQAPRHDGSGRPMLVLEVNPATPDGSKTPEKSGRKSWRETLRSSQGGFNQPGMLRFRDRKIRLLQGLARVSGGTDKDLLIGMIKDYGGEYTE